MFERYRRAAQHQTPSAADQSTLKTSQAPADTTDTLTTPESAAPWSAAELTAIGLFLAACSALWNYLGALLHPNALAYSQAFFLEDILPTYNAARQILAHAGPSMYNPAIVHGYTYSPFFAWVFTPLALLPWPAAGALWYALCHVWLWLAIIALARLFADVLPVPLLSARVLHVPLVPALAAVWLGIPPSVQASLDFGQVDYLSLALIAGAVLCLVRKRDGLAGVLVVLAAMLKITPLGLLLVFLLFRRWRAFCGGVLTLLGCIVVTSLDPRVGFESWIRMARGVNANFAFIFGQYANESIGSVFAHVLALAHHHLAATPAEYLGFVVAGVLFVAALAFALRPAVRESPRWIVAFVASIGAVLLASPLNWDHTYVVAAIPAAMLLGLIATHLLATHHLSWRDIVGVVAATIIAAWPMTAALTVSQTAGLRLRVYGTVLISARPLALVVIVCLLLLWLWRSEQTVVAQEQPEPDVQQGHA